MAEIQKLPRYPLLSGHTQERPETGPMQFGEDWPGVFIRGDNALVYAAHLRNIIEFLDEVEEGDIFMISCLKGLVETLESCKVK